MNQQKGMTIVGMLLSALFVVLLGILVMRVVPVYIEHHSILSALRALDETPEQDLSVNPIANVSVLKKRFYQQLDVNNVNRFHPKEFTITPNPLGGYEVVLKYRVVLPLFSNIYLLFKFEEVKEVKVGSD